MKKLQKIILAGLVTFPAVALAQLDGIGNLVSRLGAIIRNLIPVLLGLAVVVFFWGIIQYLFTDAKEKGSKLMFWGVIAIFVMVSIWGLIRFIRGELFVGTDFTPPPVEEFSPL